MHPSIWFLLQEGLNRALVSQGMQQLQGSSMVALHSMPKRCYGYKYTL